MNERPNRVQQEPRGFLSSLARDKRGNALMIMGATLVPLAGMIGGGIDISRMYILKTRLQHACDAGALAGRKAMASGVWTHTSGYPEREANKFFDANFETGSFGSSDLSRVFTENAGKVTGTVSAKIPMTLMKIFGKMHDTIPVTCDAEMRLPNTDVMFVLDTTGSMTSPAGGGQNRIQALRVAVKCFYEIVARLDTNAACTTGNPSGGTGNQVQIRFGFVPYSSNVNVGKLLPTGWFADSWNYETRKLDTDTVDTMAWVETGSPPPKVETLGMPSEESQCNDTVAATLNTSNTTTNGNSRTITTETYDAQYYAGGRCYGTRTTKTTHYVYKKTTTETVVGWEYDTLPINVGLLKNGATWNNSFQWPIENGGGNRTITWDGCIEERTTAQALTYLPRPADAYDLELDLMPDPNNVHTLWKPALRNAIFTRRGSGTGNWNKPGNKTDLNTNYPTVSSYNCPTESRKLQSWTNAGLFSNYVDSLATNGTTYHDIGLLWGARLVSPTGLFASENAFTPQGGEIERHLIFMTDGMTNANADDYNAYGIPWFSRRQTPNGAPPSKAQLDAQVDARFAAICTMVKNKNVTLWVIGFGDEIAGSPSTQTRLTTCASPGRYFLATDSATLQATFKSIADQISMLRLTN